MFDNKSSLKKIWLIVILVVFVLLAGTLTACGVKDSPPGIAGEEASQPVEVREISIEEAHQLYQDKVAFIDVRTSEEWNAAHVPGSTLLPLEDLSDLAGGLPKDLKLVVYCRTGNRSAEAATILLEAGFTDVYSLDGGLSDWISAGYPVDPGQ